MVETDWNVKMVRAREALALLPRVSGEDDRIDWGEVEVAHIDTGCTRNPVFGPWDANERNATIRAHDGVNYMEPGALPFDPVDYRGTPGHGTRTSSVLCGNLPGTLVGIAPGLPTIPYRAMDITVLASKKSRKRVAQAIRHAVDVNGCEVISMSIGFPQMSLFGTRHLGKAVDHAYQEGVIMVAAGGQIIDRCTYPGRFARTICVGGVGPDAKAYFKYDVASAKQSVDIWAPSDKVLRANSILVDGRVVEERPLGTGDGTSYGTVHVAAAAAMWLAFHADALDGAYPEPWQRIEAFRKVLIGTSFALKGSYWPTKADKKGILDIEALLKAPLPDKKHLVKVDVEAAGQIF